MMRIKMFFVVAMIIGIFAVSISIVYLEIVSRRRDGKLHRPVREGALAPVAPSVLLLAYYYVKAGIYDGFVAIAANLLPTIIMVSLGSGAQVG